MVSDEPTDGRCNAQAGPDKDGYCEGHPVKDDNGEPRNGRCSSHGGLSTGPLDTQAKSESMKGNWNAKKHGAFAQQENVYEFLSTDGREWVDGMIEGYVDLAPWDYDDPRIELVRRAAVLMWQDWSATNSIYTDSGGESEQFVTAVTDRGKEVYDNREHHLLKAAKRHRQSARQILSQLGLLEPVDDGNTQETAAELLAAAWQRLEESRDTEDSDQDRDVVDVESKPA